MSCGITSIPIDASWLDFPVDEFRTSSMLSCGMLENWVPSQAQNLVLSVQETTRFMVIPVKFESNIIQLQLKSFKILFADALKTLHPALKTHCLPSGNVTQRTGQSPFSETQNHHHHQQHQQHHHHHHHNHHHHL